MLKLILKNMPIIGKIILQLDNQNQRDIFVNAELLKIPKNSLLLDAGCGSQRYRSYCSHLIYKAQDFGKCKTDNKKMLGQEGMGGKYEYGELDYVGDIWSIQERDEKFDVILCTEV